MTSDELLDKIVIWAQGNDNIIALIMTGSRTRRGSTVDEFSDFDLELIASDPRLLSAEDGWMRLFADVWTVQAFDEGQAYPTRLIIYEGGHKVDFTLADRARVDRMVTGQKLNNLYGRGYRVLVDKESVTVNLPQPADAFPIVALPTQAEFDAVVGEFWFEASHMPRYLAREELWVVKFRDWTMKGLLLKMLEWHAVATSDTSVDVWYIGSHVKDWVDGETWTELQSVFARFDVQDSWRGLIATIDLLGRLGREIAAASGLTYPSDVDESIRGYILRFAHGHTR